MNDLSRAGGFYVTSFTTIPIPASLHGRHDGQRFHTLQTRPGVGLQDLERQVRRSPAFGRREHGIAGRVFGAHVYAHQVAFAIMTGQWPEAQIDHVNGRRSDNRWRNLRPTDPAENARNTAISRSNSSGVVGVSWNREKRRWWAYIHPEKGRRHLLGSFRSKADAVAVRKAAERHYGYHQNHGRKPAS